MPARVEECLHERYRLRLHAERIGIHDAARKQQRVEALRQGLVEVHIDRELVILIRAMFLLLYAAFLKLPWGSMTNFLAAPLSKSL